MKPIVFTVRFDKATMIKLDALAKKRKRTRADVIRQLVQNAAFDSSVEVRVFGAHEGYPLRGELWQAGEFVRPMTPDELLAVNSGTVKPEQLPWRKGVITANT